MDGQKAPDHSTIHRFRKKLAPFFEGMLEQFTLLLYEHGFLDLSSLYMDGTKMEAVSNKYSFVWRGSIEKFQSKLVEKIKQELDLPEDGDAQKVQKALRKAFLECKRNCKKKKIVFVYGTGKRKTEEQRIYEKYEE